MTPGDWIVGYLGTAAIIIAVLFWLAIRVAYKDGWNDRGDHEQNRRNQRALEAARRPPTRLIEQPQQPWPHHGYGRHSVWAQRLTVRTDTVSFAGGPATVPISHRTDSGELRALVAANDQYIETMRRRESDYRRQLVTR